MKGIRRFIASLLWPYVGGDVLGIEFYWRGRELFISLV